MHENTSEKSLVLPGPGDRMPDWITEGRDWNLSRITEEVKVYARISVQGIFEIGKRLLWARGSLGGDNFLKWLEAEVPIPQRTAYRFMAVAAKMGPRLDGNPAYLSLRKGTLYALLDVPDKELDRLDKAGKLDGRPLDKVDGMTGDEKNEYIRKSRANKKRYQVMAEKYKAQTAALKAVMEDKAGRRPDQNLLVVAMIDEEINLCIYKAEQLAERVDPRDVRIKSKLVGVCREAYLRLEALEGDLARAPD